MTRITKKIITTVFAALAFVAFSFGLVFTMPQVKTAKAAEVAVNFNEALLEGDIPSDGVMQIRLNTEGQTWATYHNGKTLSELPSVANYTTINGRSLMEIQNASTSGKSITVTMQPAGSFSFLRVFVPLEIMTSSEIKSVGVLNGWSLNDGQANYTSPEVTYLRTGDSLVKAENYSELTKYTASNITISDAVLSHRKDSALAGDSYIVDINLNGYTCGEFDLMYDNYKRLRSAIYINGKSIEEWNTQKIAEDARFNDPASYLAFPQNSDDASHRAVFVKPVGLWCYGSVLRLSIYQELLADAETVVVTVGVGATVDGQFMVAQSVSKTVLTQNVVDITNDLIFMDNTHNANWENTTNMYYIHTNYKSCWTKAPIGGCLNEADPAGGGQVQMKYITFNGSTLYDINKNDNGKYGSKQDAINGNGGAYAPILVTMSTELGSSLKIHVPTAYTNGKSGHEEIVIKEGFSIKEGNTSYYVSSDIIFTNNNGTWTQQVKAVEIETQVTGIITLANRTDGGNNENFVLFQLSNNDYAGLNTEAVADVSSLFGFIDFGGYVLDTKPNEPFFNVWGYANTLAFRVPGKDAAGLQQVKYITIKAGAKFPAYSTQNGGKLTYFVTTEDVTFVHNVPNDTWTVGSAATPEYTVTYTVDGAVYSTQTVEEGALAVAPATPSKDADANYVYTFKQWTLNGAAYDFSTPVVGDITLVAEFTAAPVVSTIDVTSELKFIHQAQQSAGTETYMIRTTNAYWTKAPQGGCLNEYDYQDSGAGQVQMKYLYLNGVSLYDINKDDDGSYGSAQGNIAGGGRYAPILVMMGLDATYSYIQMHVPTGYPNVELGANQNHKTFEIKAGFEVEENGITYKVTRDLKWYNVNGVWKSESEVFAGSQVTIGNVRVDGNANELYKVDIVSQAWNINCNYYDFMYGGEFANYRKMIYINGVSVYDINENTDDSSYIYSTFPMTGTGDDATFAKPVLIETKAQGGDPTTITLWIHKDYLNTLGDDVVITLGAGYNAYTGSVVLGEDVNYSMMTKLTVNDGTKTYTTSIVKGTKIGDLNVPSKPTTATTLYTFEGWYHVGTGEKLADSVVITAEMAIEARFSETSVSFIATEVAGVFYSVTGEDNGDRWLYFTLTTHDYPADVNTYQLAEAPTKITETEVYRTGLLSKIVLKGYMSLGGIFVEEATLQDVFVKNGYGEAIFLNIWGNVGTLAFRTPGVEYINEVIVEEGANFPSYKYVSGQTTVDTRYTSGQKALFVNSNEEGLHGGFKSQGAVKIDIQMATGAAVRIAANAEYTKSGLRFETKIAKDQLDPIFEDVLGECNVYEVISFGTLIAPKDYLMGGSFTHAWLDNNGLSYLDIESTACAEDGFPKEEDGYYSYFGSIVNLKKNNYNRDFAAVGYIYIYFADGTETYVYAHYDATNARSASFVANAAINDRSATQTDEYKYYISANNNYSPYSEADNKFLETYITWTEESAINSQELTALSGQGGNTTINVVNQKLAGPYVELVYSTNVNVWGVFTYTDGNKTAEEDFYLQAGTTSHKQFLDVFRKNAVGVGMDTSNLSMTSIKFTNAELANSDAPAGKVKVFGLYSQNRTIDMSKQEIYLTVAQDDGSEITVGAHLGLGGSLTYLAKSGIYEGVTSSNYTGGSVKLQTNTNGFVDTHKTSLWGTATEAGYYGSATSSKAADGAVNLINNVDAGRQIQQSWYANIGGSPDQNTGANGYNRAYCYTGSSSGQYWPYNPVQAGDVVSNPSQIVDYEINEAKGYIYVKARAMDWAKGGYKNGKLVENGVDGGVTTKSYVENYYRLNADGTLVVNNGFVDWNGFTDMELAGWASTELPAVYPVHTLNYYVSNIDGDGSWEDPIEYNANLSGWVKNPYAQVTIANKDDKLTKVEDWFAWANGGNGNAFALGVYIPNVNRFTSGRSQTSTAMSNSANRDAISDNVLADKGLMSNMQPIEYTYQSAYVTNTSYTAPGVDYRMEAYKPIEYSYVICLGTVDTIRSTFQEIKENGMVTNAGNGYEKVGLDAWARADKQWTW